MIAAAAAMLIIGINRKNSVSEASSQTLQTPYEKNSFAMDTFVIQQIYADDDTAEAAATAVDEELADLEEMMSMYNTDSQISKINNQAGMTEVNVYTPSKELYSLIKKAVGFCKSSNGSFDITVAPLVKLWNITGSDSGEHEIPSDTSIKSALERVNYKNIVLDDENKTIWLKKAFMAIDLGGVAKGYACEKIKSVYEEYGVTSAIVSFGGNICTIGSKPDGSAFSVGLRDPFGNENDIFAKITADGRIIATSGAYERYFEKDGVRYHHILSTKTGYPAESDLESVSVLSDDGTFADYMSTELFIGGTDAVVQILGESDYSVIAVDKNKNVYASENIRQNVDLSDEFVWGDTSAAQSNTDPDGSGTDE